MPPTIIYPEFWYPNPSRAAEFGGYRFEYVSEEGYMALPADMQNDAAWPKMRRILQKRNVGVQDGAYMLTRRDLHALVGRYPDLLIGGPDSMPNPKGGKSGGEARGKAGGEKSGKNSGGEKGSAARNQTGQGKQQGGNTPTKLWTPWPQAKKSHVEEARQLLQLLHEEIVESGRETAARSWNYGKLAVSQEMGRLDVARKWEKEGLPRLMIALDMSGSIGGFVKQFAALGAALAEAFPWLVVVDASNGRLFPLCHNLPAKGMIVDGEWQALPMPVMSYDMPVAEVYSGWCKLADALNIEGVIYVGDYEDHNILGAFEDAEMRTACVSIFRCNYGAPVRSDRHFGHDTPWPTVSQVGSVEDAIAALRLILEAWRRA